MSMVGLREVSELVIRERPPSTLRNIDGGPSGGAGAGDPELKAVERPLSMIRNIDGRSPRGAGGRYDNGHHRC
jgi:hypothetical protein